MIPIQKAKKNRQSPRIYENASSYMGDSAPPVCANLNPYYRLYIETPVPDSLAAQFRLSVFFSSQLQYDEHCQLPKSAMRTSVVTWAYSLLSIAACWSGNSLHLCDMHLSFDLNLTSRRSGASRLPAPAARSGLRSLHCLGEDNC